MELNPAEHDLLRGMAVEEAEEADEWLEYTAERPGDNRSTSPIDTRSKSPGQIYRENLSKSPAKSPAKTPASAAHRLGGRAWQMLLTAS